MSSDVITKPQFRTWQEMERWCDGAAAGLPAAASRVGGSSTGTRASLVPEWAPTGSLVGGGEGWVLALEGGAGRAGGGTHLTTA